MDKIPVILALDTSSSVTSVAVRHQGETLSYIESRERDSHNEILARLVEEALLKSGMSYQDLSLLMIGAGPGSFTGLRIGFAFLKGISAVLRKPIIPVSSLKCYAACCMGSGSLIASLGDARRNEFFCSVFLVKSGELVTLLSEQILDGQEVEDKLSFYQQEQGVGVEESMIVFCEKECPYKFKTEISHPNRIAEGLSLAGEMGMDREVAAARDGEDRYSVAPNYVRRAAARTIAERKAEKT